MMYPRLCVSFGHTRLHPFQEPGMINIVGTLSADAIVHAFNSVNQRADEAFRAAFLQPRHFFAKVMQRSCCR